MYETAYPVLVYRVSYPGCFRTARMAFLTMQGYMASFRFMRGNGHYEVLRTDYLTEGELAELGIHFADAE